MWYRVHEDVTWFPFCRLFHKSRFPFRVLLVENVIKIIQRSWNFISDNFRFTPFRTHNSHIRQDKIGNELWRCHISYIFLLNQTCQYSFFFLKFHPRIIMIKMCSIGSYWTKKAIMTIIIRCLYVNIYTSWKNLYFSQSEAKRKNNCLETADHIGLWACHLRLIRPIKFR